VSDRVVQAYKLQGMGSDVVTIVIPRGAEQIDFSPYDGVPSIWAIVDLGEPLELRRFRMVPTGFTIPEGGRYVGSATLNSGSFYAPMHFFEIPLEES
jgi:hypothetical protein